jgi:succinate dehydrogenase / fumarate reductase cytochrome b subunit
MSENPNAQNQRPLSPHLGIYRPQITSMLSIAHRITGVALFIGALLFSWWIFLNVYGCGTCVNALLDHIVTKIFLVGWTLALYYHLFNGIRHLYWDMGRGFKLCSVHFSGWFVVVLTLASTAATWAAVLGFIRW